MAFDNIGTITLGGFQQVTTGMVYGAGDDHGAQYVGAHLIFPAPASSVMVDGQRVDRRADGAISYFATFHNLLSTPVAFTLTGGGFI
jgi:hypothetical protein